MHKPTLRNPQSSTVIEPASWAPKWTLQVRFERSISGKKFAYQANFLVQIDLWTRPLKVHFGALVAVN